MSSLTRKMQLAQTRRLPPSGFYEIGSRLGVTNDKDKALLARVKREKARAQ